ncbi:protein of unknown function [Streptomyces sp. BpilaLS-43]|uniref:DUF397 domain-containing protein n=1 Tax=Streptomyces sp. BpilaLS-43 TaxID=1839778 RepID=UPI00081B6C6D|nr:DUF397 domain-containing protein [Streptomyces sp. BpilaLS-43]SCD69434.1 protein of unknown function [Streptomyces sp. BpilaLS-43]
MINFQNGVPASSMGDVRWVKSSASNPAGGDCVRFAELPNGEVAMSNSRFPEGPALVFTRSEIKAMLAGARQGEFDSMAA